MAKQPSVSSSLSNLIVRGKDGGIDKDATLAKFELLLLEYASTSMALHDRVSLAVNAVFDAHRGERLITDYLISETLTRLGPSKTESRSAQVKQIRDFLKESSDFDVGRGFVGGWARTADQVQAVSDSANESSDSANESDVVAAE